MIFISSQLVSSSLSSCAPIISSIIAVRACSFPRKLKCGGAGAKASSLNSSWLKTGRVSSHAIGSIEDVWFLDVVPLVELFRRERMYLCTSEDCRVLSTMH